MEVNRYIKRAMQLALRGKGLVSPNPRVGAVIVGEDGAILAEGWHKRYGSAHAEVEALNNLSEGSSRGATLYVTLEPCAHHHHTPPCTEAIITAGIKRVRFITLDPNPRVNGRGVEILQQSGIETEMIGDPILAREINRGFFTWMEQGRAWCEAKIALSIDGKMANSVGWSKWISGEKSRRLAHRLRADLDSVMVGSGTVTADDPELTVRLVRGPNPARIVLAPNAGIPTVSKLAQSAEYIRTILLHGDDSAYHIPPHVESVSLPLQNDYTIDPVAILKKLPELGSLSVLIEGGAGVLSSFMRAGVIDRITIAYSPSVIGKGISPFEHFAPNSWSDRPFYEIESTFRLGEDVIVRYDRRTAPFSPV